MFTQRYDDSTIRRYAAGNDDLPPVSKYFIQDATTRQRVGSGRSYPSIMAAFLALGAMIPPEGSVLHIVDAEGEVVYAPHNGVDEADVRRPRYAS